MQVGTANDWKTAQQGQESTGAIRSNGTLCTWFLNKVYYLGNNIITRRPNPLQIGTATDWKKAQNCFTGTGFALKNNGIYGVGAPIVLHCWASQH